MEKVENLLGSLSQMDRESFLNVSSKLCADIILLKGAGKGINALSKLPGKIKGSGFLETVESNLTKALTEHPSLTTPEGFTIKAPQIFEETNVLKNTAEKNLASTTQFKNMHPKLAENISTFQKLDKSFSEIAKTARKESPGRILENINVSKYEQIESDTIKYYEKVRKMSEDVSKIAKNIGVDESIVQQIKRHVFLDDHILYDGIRRFDPNPDMAAAWKRLIENDFFQSDLVLLQHELVESIIMNGTEVAYSEAHKIANGLYNWDKTL